MAVTLSIFQDRDGDGSLNAGEQLLNLSYEADALSGRASISLDPGLPSRPIAAANEKFLGLADGTGALLDITIIGEVVKS